MSFIETADKTQIFYNDWGSGSPVVLIHGWPLSSTMWEYQVGPLVEAGYRVVSYDRRGFGKSSQPWSGYDYDTFASDLHDLMEKLELTDAALVGFSMGGGEVARYLGKYGAGRVSKAVLISAVTPFMLKTDEHPDGAPKSTFDGIIAGLKDDRPHFLAGFAPAFYGKTMTGSKASKEVLDDFVAVAMQASPKATTDCVTAFGETDFRKDMAAFTIPTLIVHGVDDKTVPIDISARQAVKLVPSATLKEYDGEAHGLTTTAKDKLNADLIAFLGS